MQERGHSIRAEYSGGVKRDEEFHGQAANTDPIIRAIDRRLFRSGPLLCGAATAAGKTALPG